MAIIMNIIECILGSDGKFHRIQALCYSIEMEFEYNQMPATVNGTVEVSLANL